MAQTMSLIESTDSRDSVPMRDSGPAMWASGLPRWVRRTSLRMEISTEAGSQVVVQIAGNPRA